MGQEQDLQAGDGLGASQDPVRMEAGGPQLPGMAGRRPHEGTRGTSTRYFPDGEDWAIRRSDHYRDNAANEHSVLIAIRCQRILGKTI